MLGRKQSLVGVRHLPVGVWVLCVCKLNVYEGVGNLDHPVPAKRPSAYDVPVPVSNFA